MKKEKKTAFFTLLFSILLFLTIVTGRMIIFNGSVYGSWSENTFRSLNWNDLVAGVLLTVILSTLFFLAWKKSCSITRIICDRHHHKWSEKKIRNLFWGVLMLLWLPYLLTYAPGSVLEDSLASIYYPVNSNLHPVLYSLWIKACYYFGCFVGSANVGIYIYTCIQYALLSWVIAYGITWLYQNNVSRYIILALIVFYGIFPVFPAYAMILWKDPLFSSALYILGFLLLRIEQEHEKKYSLYLILGVCAVCFLRNNGLFVTIPLGVILFLKRKGQKNKNIRIFLFAMLGCLIIQYPVYKALGIGTQGVEAFGIPLQQISYVVIEDNISITSEQWEIIGHFFDIEKLKSVYAPCIVDTVKWSSAFYADYFELHRTEFINLWISLLPNHLEAYIRSWLLATLGFWHLWLQNEYGYISFGVVPNVYGITKIDLLQKWFNWSANKVFPMNVPMIGSGSLFWIAFFGFLQCLVGEKKQRCYFYLPQLLCWLCFVVGTPVAFSLRYVFSMMLALPVNILLPFLPEREQI